MSPQSVRAHCAAQPSCRWSSAALLAPESDAPEDVTGLKAGAAAEEQMHCAPACSPDVCAGCTPDECAAHRGACLWDRGTRACVKECSSDLCDDCLSEWLCSNTDGCTWDPTGMYCESTAEAEIFQVEE